MASPPFMQLYVADFLADTQPLTTEEIGAYFLILMTMWRAGGKLPHDQKVLSRSARLSGRSWATAWDRLAPLFMITEGQVSHKRLAKEFDKAMQKSAIRSQSGKRGGAAKALKTKDVALANATVLPKHLLQMSDNRKKKQVFSPSEPLQASLLADASETVKPSAKQIEADFDEFYRAFPRRVGRGDAERAYAKARKFASAAQILAGANGYAATRAGEDQQYTKHPATWLNGKGWLDDRPGTSGTVSDPDAGVSVDLWVWRLGAFHHGDAEQEVKPGYWQAKWGPEPGQAGCRAPQAAVAAYAAQNRPRATGTGS